MSTSTTDQIQNKGILVNIPITSLTSPAEGTGQLTAQEAASNDCDGLDVSGDLIQ